MGGPASDRIAPPTENSSCPVDGMQCGVSPVDGLRPSDLLSAGGGHFSHGGGLLFDLDYGDGQGAGRPALQCVDSAWICDGFPDCNDASDEAPQRCANATCG